MARRKAWVEHPFGTIKTWMGKIPLKLRGLAKVQTEIDIYVTSYNLKRLLGINETLQIIKAVKAYNWKMG